MRAVAQQDGARRAALLADAAHLNAHFDNDAEHIELLWHAACCYILRNMLLLTMLNIFNVKTQAHEANALPPKAGGTPTRTRAAMGRALSLSSPVPGRNERTADCGERSPLHMHAYCSGVGKPKREIENARERDAPDAKRGH